MNLQDTLLKDLQQAIRAKDAVRRNTLRLLRAALANAEVESGHALNEEESTGILTREAKRRREAIDQFLSLGRQDLVEQAKIELAIVEEYLPRQMTHDELEALVRQIAAEMAARTSVSAGEIMRQIMPKVKGRADGKMVSQVVNEVLSEKK